MLNIASVDVRSEATSPARTSDEARHYLEAYAVCLVEDARTFGATADETWRIAIRAARSAMNYYPGCNRIVGRLQSYGLSMDSAGSYEELYRRKKIFLRAVHSELYE